MNSKLTGAVIIVILVVFGIFLYQKNSGSYRITQLEVSQEMNPPSFNGIKSSKAENIIANVQYRDLPKNLEFNSTCQNADLILKHIDGREVPKITTRICGAALTTRYLKSGDTIEAQELFDMSNFESGTYTLSFSYKSVLSFDKQIEIK